MTEPLLNGPQIHSSPQASRGERVAGYVIANTGFES